MEFKLDERLTAYMQENNHRNILITPEMCHT